MKTRVFHLMAGTLSIFFSAAILIISLSSCQKVEKADDLIRVGIYDTRVIALVYYRSEAHMEYINQLKKERNEAEKAGDEEKVALLERKGPGLQELAHKQGFSTLPIPGLLEKIHDSLPSIAKRLNLDVIMNKWEIAYQAEEVKLVDVTKEMIGFFNPSEETYRIVDQMAEVDPVPLVEIFREDVETWCPEYR
ncbi:MAG: hypothetical protein R2764_06930 [Bacteroidales bacterium]